MKVDTQANQDDTSEADSFTKGASRANTIPEGRYCADANAARLRELAQELGDYRAAFPPSATLFREIQEALKGAALELERTTVERERIPELFDAACERTEDPELRQVLAGIERAFERALIERDRYHAVVSYLENCGPIRRDREEKAAARAKEAAEFHRGTNFAAIRAAHAISDAEAQRLEEEHTRWLENQRRA